MEFERTAMSESEEEEEYEVITIDPNVNYESEDETMEDLSQHNCSTQTAAVEIENPNPAEQHACNQEVEVKVAVAETQTVDEVPCDNIAAIIEDENSNSNDSMKRVRKKLNLAEYKKRRANEVPQKPLFDLPRKIAAFELCDVPASLPLLILPTDPNWSSNGQVEIKKEPVESEAPKKLAFNPEVYEEIVMVSIGCNTDITLSPHDDTEDGDDKGKFLKNIVNNLKKDNADNLLNSATSLFSSIQAVVQEKCLTTDTSTEPTIKIENGQGEDKIIMHLKKNRLRPFKCNVGLQTDNISLFPPLLLSPSLIFNRIKNARSYRRKMSRSRSRSRSRSFSPNEGYERVRYHSNSGRYSRSQHSTHSSSMNSSDTSSSDSGSGSESDTDASEYSCRSSADSLKRFNDRQNFRFYNRNQQNQGYRNFQGKSRVLMTVTARLIMV